MKFAVAVVMLALAFGTESSVIPWGAPLSYTAVSGPGLVAVAPVPHASVAVHARNLAAGPGTVVAAQAPVWAPAPAIALAAPAVVAAHAAPAVVAAPAIVAAPAHEGSYIAKTRGAVHVAPLAGHANSAASINLQPAPGTI